MALHALRKLEACHVGTDKLGNGAVAEVAPVAVGSAWALGRKRTGFLESTTSSPEHR